MSSAPTARPWHADLGPLPTLHLEDTSAIPFVDGIPGVCEYQHRARARAADGDVFASTTEPAPGYEAYCRDFLGLGRVECLVAPPIPSAPSRVARALLDDEPSLARLAAIAADAEGLIVHPYMGIEEVWELADAIARRADRPAWVLAPGAEALWLANDKSNLDRLARSLDLGDALVETARADSPSALVGPLRELASRHERVALKRTRCAAAMGNLTFDARQIVAESERETRARCEAFWERTACQRGEEVLIVEWAASVSSPSTQYWIEPGAEPRLDGVYEQLLEGPERSFLGSKPSELGEAIERQLVAVSDRLCRAFAARGYIGRCSFDFIVTPRGRAKLTECNGRWGGTSTPMHLVDRVVAGPRPAYIARDIIAPALVGRTFPKLRAALEPELYDPNTGRGRYILYNVGPLEAFGKFDVIALGEDAAGALEAIGALLERVEKGL